MTGSSNFNPGEFTIDSIALVNQDGESVEISKLVVGFKLYESIYKKFCTAELALLDGLDLLKYYKMTGQEYCRISIRQREGVGEEASEEYSIDKTFRIYKVENVQRPQEKIQTYVIKMCDPRVFFSRRKRLSTTMRGSWDQILQKTLIESAHFKAEEFDFWEKSDPENYQFISPNWTVSTLIDFITSNASKTSSSYLNGFFFFQSLNGGFRFMDISTMFSREFPLEFSYKPRNNAETDKVDINAPEGLNTQIMHYEKPKLFDTLTGTINGMYSSFMKVYNPVKKIEEDVLYDMSESFAKKDHVSGFPLIRLDTDEKVLTIENMTDPTVSPPISEVDVDLAPNKNIYTTMNYSSTMVHPFDDVVDISEPEVFRGLEEKDSARLQRKALMETLDQHKLLVTLPLRTDLSVGTIIKLVIPPAESNAGTVTDKMNDNRYLITGMSIEGSPISYTGVCHLECVKQSYAADIASVDALSSSQDPENV